MLAAFRNQKLLLAQYVRHTGANFSASDSLCIFLQLSLVNCMARDGRYSQHIEIIIRTLHIVAWCLQRVAAKI